MRVFAPFHFHETSFQLFSRLVFRGGRAQRQEARYKPKSVTDCARSARVAGLALSGYIQSETLLLAWLIQGVTR
jgi:hypothetical protein